MDLALAGKTALVAGSSRGIGKAIACAFLREGCRTVITGRTEESLAETAGELVSAFGEDRVTVCLGDLTKREDIRAVLEQVRERWGEIDCLVANIGSGRGPRGWELNSPDWDSALATNLLGGANLTAEALPGMMKAGGGSVVFISSIAGIESSPAPLPYSAAKAALIAYSKNLARRVAKHNIRVNCVSPGNVLFPRGSWEAKLAEKREEVMGYLAVEVPMCRFGSPEEIADAVVFLSSGRASFITGACLVVDGGQTRSL